MPEHGPAQGPARLSADIRAALRDVADFPRPGIAFKDITPLLADAALFRRVTTALAEPWADAGITHVVAVESRGFVFGAPVAQHLGAGFVPVRKPGKLPFRRYRIEYALEYGTDILEIHEDACGAGARVLLVDDVLATGGTALAAASLVEQASGTILGAAFVIELAGLGGRARLPAGCRAVALTTIQLAP